MTQLKKSIALTEVNYKTTEEQEELKELEIENTTYNDIEKDTASQNMKSTHTPTPSHV